MPIHLLGVAALPRCGRPACFSADSKLHRNEVFWVLQEDIAAVVMSAHESALAPLLHATLLEAIHQHMDVLPVRYGVTLPDQRAVGDFLQQRRVELLESLGRLAGTGELGLRILLPTTPDADVEAATAAERPSSSPAQYLALRRQRYQRTDRRETQSAAVVTHCLQSLSGLYREQRRLDSRQPGIVRLAFLVSRERWKIFQRRAELLASSAESTSGARGTLLGPWPPYSFV